MENIFRTKILSTFVRLAHYHITEQWVWARGDTVQCWIQSQHPIL